MKLQPLNGFGYALTIEQAFAKLKVHQHKATDRSIPTLWGRNGSALNLFSPATTQPSSTTPATRKLNTKSL